MQKQNSGSGDFTIDISTIKNEVKSVISDLENNRHFQRILESQANFLIENEEEQEYSDAVAWLIHTARKSFVMAIASAHIASGDDDDKHKAVNVISQEIYNDLYEEKKPRPKLRLVK